tara:strand:+ start:693 stop:1370 length:678 start_codon:yes stop_codon:yes gene_type:complete
MKKIIGQPEKTNSKLIDLIKRTKINNYYIKNQKDFRNRIIEDIKINDDILDIGKGMRDKFTKIKAKKILTVDVNDFGDYPDIVYDICSELDETLIKKFDKIICIAVLEHVYDPFQAVRNIRMMLKDNGVLYGYVPYLFYYHAPTDLKFQDYFRFSKDALSYLFKDFKNLEIFPIRGRISTPLNILFQPRWKRHIEKTGINILLDKFTSDTKNIEQCSGFNFIVKK